jgi:hypothetical protein
MIRPLGAGTVSGAATWSRGRAARLAAAGAYLAGTLTVTYALWNRYDGVAYDPAWATEPRVWAALLVLHVLVGAAVGRWWALLLPLAWVLLSWPAEGYDTPVWVVVAFSTPVYWIPALAAGVLVRRLVGRFGRRPDRGRRAV